MGYTIEEVGGKVDRLEDKTEQLVDHEMREHCDHHHGKEKDMDIAGLLSLVTQNKGMDPLALAALMKEKGGEGAFGGGGLGILVLLLFIMMMNNGTFGGGNNQASAQQLAASAGFDLQTVTSMYDRHSATLQAVNQGFASAQTALCSSIAEVVGAVRNQSDRTNDNINSLSRQMADCCCKLEAGLVSLGCQIGAVKATVELTGERNINAMQAMECRLSEKINENRNLTALGFERTNCHIDNVAKDARLAALERENCELKTARVADCTADAVVHRMERFATQHYVPTRPATC
ncbi:MAG: hypothetical protein RR609_07110 [Aurantimicrobium sp.]